jgi:transcription initiation factor TFIIF subunit alpha
MIPAPFKRPKKDAEALLFHPKKKTSGSISTITPPSSQPRPTPSSSKASVVHPKQVLDADEEALQLPTGNFQEFRLVSSALNGWKYDVMKFDSRKTIDIGNWQAPIKLNRKELKRDDRGTNGSSSSAVPVKPMLGPDGKPVIGPDGKVVMVDAMGRPIHSSGVNGEASGSGLSKDKGKGPANGRKKFQKKTRQVFLLPESTRQLRKEERYPWIMEDASGKEIWVGKLEDLSKSETHAFFMPTANDVFKFVPAHRWYKFQKKPNYYIPNLEEAESIVGAWFLKFITDN